MAKAVRQAGGRSGGWSIGRGRSVYATQRENRRVTVAQITSPLRGYSLFNGVGPNSAGGNEYVHGFEARNKQPGGSSYANKGNIDPGGHRHSSSHHHANPYHGASHLNLRPFLPTIASTTL
jgi:hypothetical protein